jgi:hypothetical protein
MTFRKLILLLTTLGMIAALVACSSSSTKAPTGPLANGNYVFSLSGEDANGSYFVSGAFTVAGTNITAGEQDFADPANPDLFDQIASGTITTTTDGNFQIVLNTGDANLGVGGTETFNGTILPSNTTGKSFLNEFDASASGNGGLEAQSSPAALSGGYAFVIGGEDANLFALSIGGVINVDSAGGISGTGSIFDVNDGGSGTDFAGETLAASTVTATPDSFGRVTFTLNPTDSEDFPNIVLQAYIVDSNHLKLVEGNGGAFDGFGGTTGGGAYAQGANTGTFTAASAQNTYVAGLVGFDEIGVIQVAAQITPNSDGGVTGFMDFNDLFTVEPASPDPLTASTYSVDPTGDVTIPGLTDGVNSLNVQLYLDGNGHALGITLDTGDVIGGSGYQQSGAGSFTAASFSGAYALGAGGADVDSELEISAVGPFTADGVGTTTGFVDLNWADTEAVANAPVTGTFTAASTGIFTGTMTGLDVTTCTIFSSGGPGCTTDVFNYYLIDATGDNIAIETDFNQITLGVFEQQ